MIRSLLTMLVAGRRGRHPMQMRAGAELEHLGGNRYRSNGFSPALILDTPLGNSPRGWVIVRLEVLRTTTCLRPLLRALGEGGEDVIASFALPATETGTAETLLRLPDDTAGLILSPTDRPAEFTLGRLELREVSPIRVGLLAALRRPRAFMRAAAKLPRTGLTAFKYELLRLLRPDIGDYATWIRLYDALSADDETAIRLHVEKLAFRPKISIVLPVWDTSEPLLRAAIDSVLQQLYADWELCIADDASTEPHVSRLLGEYAKRDQRIKVAIRSANGGIAAASNSALDLATGEFIALLDHDDVLAPHALYMVAAKLNLHPDADVIYSDADTIDTSGRRREPFFKPDWDPDRFFQQNYINHLGVYRASLVREIGGFRAGFEGSQDYDLALRVVARTVPQRIQHLPFVLYHWRIYPGARTFSTTHRSAATLAARRALREFFAARGERVEVLDARVAGWHRIRRLLSPEPPLVSLIVPTRDGVELLRACVEGLTRRTRYPKLEVLIVDNGSEKPETLRYLASVVEDARVRVIEDRRPFNFSALNNHAARVANGTVLGFINNDIDVIASDWLGEMVSLLEPAEVGAVGAKLCYIDDTVQHAGVVLGLGGVAGHIEKHAPRSDPGYFGQLQLVRAVSAVTAACMLVKRHAFESVGGFDSEDMAIAFNDVDLCLKLIQSGYRILWTPYAELYHLESATRGSDQLNAAKRRRFKAEILSMRRRWGTSLESDSCYSPNLSLATEDVELAFPPRARRPWISADWEDDGKGRAEPKARLGLRSGEAAKPAP